MTSFKLFARKLKEKITPSDGRWFCVFVLAYMTPVLLVILVAHFVFHEDPATGHFTDIALRVFIIWVLAFTPGWMFRRFLKGRATALWKEFVYNLHRLHWDAPQNLPEPPKNTRFHAAWQQARDAGSATRPADNIYREKFSAYYFRPTRHAIRTPKKYVRPETAFPVYLATLVLTVYWTAFFWNPGALVPGPGGHVSLWSTLAFSFLGAYAFIIQMLMRRFYQSDLRASAYLNAVTHIIVVSLIALAIFPLLSTIPTASAIAVAFIIGFFPTVGFDVLRQVAAKTVRRAIPPLRPDYPLSEIDGLNIWYERLLLEEGIEDMQSLTTANLVDVILHTSVPVGRLMDWIDQAYLYLQLPAESRKKNNSQGARWAFRSLGIRTATDLLDAFPPNVIGDDRPLPSRMSGMLTFLRSAGVAPATVRALVQVLDGKPGLNPVLNWQDTGVRRRYPPPVLAQPRRPAPRYRPPTGRAAVMQLRARLGRGTRRRTHREADPVGTR